MLLLLYYLSEPPIVFVMTIVQEVRRLGKRLIIILSVLLVIGIGLISYNLMAQSAEVSNEKKTDEVTTNHASENSDPADIDKSPFTKYITMENVDDDFMQTHIHWMSHQRLRLVINGDLN